MPENRQHPRIRSYLRGEVIHSGGSIRIECTVRDLSSEGARLQVPQHVALPDPFDLHIPQRGVVERARIIWRHGDETGVHFDRRPAAESAHVPAPVNGAAADRPVLARMDALEAEMNRLRQQMAVMRSKIDQITMERG